MTVFRGDVVPLGRRRWRLMLRRCAWHSYFFHHPALMGVKWASTFGITDGICKKCRAALKAKVKR